MSATTSKVDGGKRSGGDIARPAGDGDINVDAMIVKDLRVELKKHGLSTAGRKAEMQERLKLFFSSQNSNDDTSCVAKGATREPDAGSSMKSPPPTESRTDEELQVVTEPRPSKKSDENPPEDWRVHAEERRKAALAIRASKKMKIANDPYADMPELEPQVASDTGAKMPGLVTPSATSAHGSSPLNKIVFNPYAKEADASSRPPAAAAAAACSAATKSPVINPYAKKSPPAAASSSAEKSPVTNPYAKKSSATAWMSEVATVSTSPALLKPKPFEDLPKVTSMWGDCRLDLWEALCTCGGERKAPDVRMCRCLAKFDAGLGCDCNRGVLLIKSGPRGPFWGCSTYKKKGCKLTKKFGPPYDAEARRELALIKQQRAERKKRELDAWARIADPFEKEWRSVCRCDGAKELNTFECFMQSNGGCGMLPLCPVRCGGALFLHDSRYGKGKWWGCSNYKKGLCKFSKNYVEHRR